MNLAAALSAYGLRPEAAILVSDKPGKPVWWLPGDLYLKHLPYRAPRVRFALGAAEYLWRRGVAVPRLVPTVAGELFAQVEGDCFALLEGVPGDPPDYGADLETVAAAMARFHAGSRGYRVPPGGRDQDHRDTWIPGYVKGIGHLRAAAAMAQVGHPLAEPLRSHASEALALARLALDRLAAAYPAAAGEAERDPILCHQDFAASNLRVDPAGRVVAFDLEGVARDLAPRDIRKLLNKVAKVAGRWRREDVERVLAAYGRERPLSQAERGVLVAELTFPHLMAGLSKKLFLRSEPEWPPADCLRRLQAVAEVECSKVPVVEALAAEWGVGA